LGTKLEAPKALRDRDAEDVESDEEWGWDTPPSRLGVWAMIELYHNL